MNDINGRFFSIDSSSSRGAELSVSISRGCVIAARKAPRLLPPLWDHVARARSPQNSSIWRETVSIGYAQLSL